MPKIKGTSVHRQRGSDSGVSCISVKSNETKKMKNGDELGFTPFIISFNTEDKKRNVNGVEFNPKSSSLKEPELPDYESSQSSSSIDEEDERSDCSSSCSYEVDAEFENSSLDSSFQTWVATEVPCCDVITSVDPIFKPRTPSSVNGNRDSPFLKPQVPAKSSPFVEDDCLSLFANSEYSLEEDSHGKCVNVIENVAVSSRAESFSRESRIMHLLRQDEVNVDVDMLVDDLSSLSHNKQTEFWTIGLTSDCNISFMASVFSKIACANNNTMLLKKIISDVMESPGVYDKHLVIKSVMNALVSSGNFSLETSFEFVADSFNFSSNICDILLSIIVQEDNFLSYWSHMDLLLKHGSQPIDPAVFEAIANEAAIEDINSDIIAWINRALKEKLVDTSKVSALTMERIDPKLKHSAKDIFLIPSNCDNFLQNVISNVKDPKRFVRNLVGQISKMEVADFQKFLLLLKNSIAMAFNRNCDANCLKTFQLIAFSILPELYIRKDFESGALILKLFWMKLEDFLSIDCLTKYKNYRSILKTPDEKFLFILKFFSRSTESQLTIEIIKKPEMKLSDRSRPKLHEIKMNVIERFLEKLFMGNLLHHLYEIISYLLNSDMEESDKKNGIHIWKYVYALFERLDLDYRIHKIGFLNKTDILLQHFSSFDLVHPLKRRILSSLYEQELEISKFTKLFDSCSSMFPQATDHIMICDQYTEVEVQMCVHVYFYKMLRRGVPPIDTLIKVKVMEDLSPQKVTLFSTRLIVALDNFRLLHVCLTHNNTTLYIDQVTCKLILEKLRRSTTGGL